MLDQPLGAEASQRLPHRPAADGKARRQLALDQSRAGRDAARQNIVAQASDNERDRRPMGRRVRAELRFFARLAGRVSPFAGRSSLGRAGRLTRKASLLLSDSRAIVLQ